MRTGLCVLLALLLCLLRLLLGPSEEALHHAAKQSAEGTPTHTSSASPSPSPSIDVGFFSVVFREELDEAAAAPWTCQLFCAGICQRPNVEVALVAVCHLRHAAVGASARRGARHSLSC